MSLIHVGRGQRNNSCKLRFLALVEFCGPPFLFQAASTLCSMNFNIKVAVNLSGQDINANDLYQRSDPRTIMLAIFLIQKGLANIANVPIHSSVSINIDCKLRRCVAKIPTLSYRSVSFQNHYQSYSRNSHMESNWQDRN